MQPAPFAAGNIAPDSGIPDEKWDKFDPPAEVTHFRVEARTDIYCADLEFYRRHLLPLRRSNQAEILSFRWGYFFHLVTDNLWHRQVSQPTREKYAADFDRDPDFIWEVKKDWYGLDFIHLRDHPGSLFFTTFLSAQPLTSDLDFLPLEGVRQRVAYIQDYYQRSDEKMQSMYNRPFQYLSGAEMDRFVDETTARLHRMYNQLWIAALPTHGEASALDVIQ
jgi:hypothetical protein